LNSTSRLVIIDLAEITNPKTRTNIVGLILGGMFNQNKKSRQRRLIILEEAHNFAPERGYGDTSASKENLSLSMIRKISAEGRKFNLGIVIITQRPAQVSKYVLSQLNTQVMFKTINLSDIDMLKTSVEQARESMLNMLPSLTTGNALLSGVGAPFSTFFEV
ncbi:MAG: ATP-binding protein, partial [Aquificaceae bacterium]|nr:ATP-binding protein [Aquificaceae bacterium]